MTIERHLLLWSSLFLFTCASFLLSSIDCQVSAQTCAFKCLAEPGDEYFRICNQSAVTCPGPDSGVDSIKIFAVRGATVSQRFTVVLTDPRLLADAQCGCQIILQSSGNTGQGTFQVDLDAGGVFNSSGQVQGAVTYTASTNPAVTMETGGFILNIRSSSCCPAFFTLNSFSLVLRPVGIPLEVCTPPPSGMVSWWPGDGNANDIQGSNHGVLHGVTFAPGEVGPAFSFDGIDDFVDFGNAVGNFGTSDFTIDFWIQTSSTRGVGEGVIGKRSRCNMPTFGGWDIRNGPGPLLVELDQEGDMINFNHLSAIRTVNDGVFHHVALVRQGPTASLYIDGILDSSNTTPGVTNLNTAASLIAGKSTCTGVDGTNFFTGLLDEIEIYDRALSAAEVQAIFRANCAGKCKPTVCCNAPNVMVANDRGQCGAVVNYATPTTTCNCGTIICSPPPGSFFPIGTITVNCQSSERPACSFTVTVADTEPPRPLCPAGIIAVATPGQCSVRVNFTASVQDNCPGATVIAFPPSGTVFPIGTTTVILLATDAAFNHAACTFTVIVRNPLPPTIACPPNILSVAPSNQCFVVVAYPLPLVSSNCPGTVGRPVCSPPPNSTFPVGVTRVTCQVSDTSNNVSSCSFTVTIKDVQPPSITCPPGILATIGLPRVGPGCPIPAATRINYPLPRVQDNCFGLRPLCAPPSGSFFSVGNTIVTCTVLDPSGNSAFCSFPVTVFSACMRDDINPGNSVLFNIQTGAYRFYCNGVLVAAGTGTLTVRGCMVTIRHSTAALSVVIAVDETAKRGTASLQMPPGTLKCSIADRDLSDNPCLYTP